jgi:hypothetical protein
MIRQRALAWAAVLALVFTVQIAPLQTRFTASGAALAQDESASDAGQPTDLAIVALHCAEAPAGEALTSYFANATPPTRCAPAVGVAIAVTENGDPVPGSPFTTDVAGTLKLPVGLGSAVTANEDPKSLPAGYEPLTNEANGVPYANPVQLDPAVAGAAVLFVNVPSSVVTELNQGTSADAAEPTDLAVVALHCADAPATEALSSFFSNGTPPSGCAPAAGVTVVVTENDKLLSGSPFQTDAAGGLRIPVSVGSSVEVREDPASLPDGYEPLTQQVNGVPYANPVQLDSAMDGAAVLFVNLPSSVAERVQRTSVAEASEPIDQVDAVTSNVDAAALASTAPDRTGCDPAYPDERTCIPPGRPLAAPCSITDERNFTVLAPDPRALDYDGDGIGCEPFAPIGGSINNGADFNAYASGYARFAAPANNEESAVAANSVRTGDGAWGLNREGTREGLWVWHPDRIDDDFEVVYRDHNRAGLWFVPRGHIGTGNVAVASNPVVIGSGAWFWPNSVFLGNLTIARSGSDNLAVVSNPVAIGNGLWARPGHIKNKDDWFWRGNDRSDHRQWPGNAAKGVWFWPGNSARAGNGGIAVCNANGGTTLLGDVNSGGNHGDTIAVGNTYGSVYIDGGTVINRTSIDLDANGGYCRADASGGTGNLAVASNPIVIGSGVSTWPGRTRLGNDNWRWPNHSGDDLWFWQGRFGVSNLTLARSGNGNVAVVSNPIFIGNRLRTWPNRPGSDDWRWHNRFGNGIWGWPSSINVGNLAIASNPVFISSGVWHRPGHISNGFRLWPNRSNNGHWRWPNHFGNGVWGWPSTIRVGNLTIARSGSGNVAIVSNPIVIVNGAWFVPPDRKLDDWFMRGDSNRAETSDVQPLMINGELTVEPAASGQPPSDGKFETLTIDDGLAIAPPAGGSVEEPSTSSIEPPSDNNAEPPTDGNVAPAADTAGQPPDAGAPDAGYVDPGVDPSYVATDPNHVDPAVDPGIVAPDPGIDPGYVAPDQANVAPDPGYSPPESSYVDPGVDPSYVEPSVEPGYVDPGTAAIDPSNGAPETAYTQPEPVFTQEPIYVEPANVAPDPSIDAGNYVPDPGYVDPGIGPSNVDLGSNSGYVDPGNATADSSYVAPDFSVGPGNGGADPSFDAGGSPGNIELGGDAGGDSGNVAPNPDAGHGERDRGDGNG